MDKIQGKIHAPFGPVIMEFQMPQFYIDVLNKYGDTISANKKKSKELDFSKKLAGNVIQEHIIENHIWKEETKTLPSFFMWVASCLNIYMKKHEEISMYQIKNSGLSEENHLFKKKGKMTNVNLHSSWIVNSVAGDFNPPHTHSGLVSAAGWTMVPQSIEKDQEKDNAGWIEFLFADPHPLLSSKFPVKPTVGKVMFFPSWLQHQVYPFRGKGIRRSISFNATPVYE